jgi:rhodanese-related sulfurtransferase
MKKLLLFVFLISLLTVCGFSENNEGDVEVVFYTDVTAQEAEVLITENVDNEHFIILDVRTPSEYNAGHIDGATNVNYNASDFVEQLNKLDKTDIYLLYCASGNRSSKALKKMKELGFTKIYHLKKGYSGWKRR